MSIAFDAVGIRLQGLRQPDEICSRIQGRLRRTCHTRALFSAEFRSRHFSTLCVGPWRALTATSLFKAAFACRVREAGATHQAKAQELRAKLPGIITGL